MPLNLHATVTADGILLIWDPPEPVTIKHGYSDTPLYYRIYRRVEGGKAEPVGTSQEPRYLDQTAQPGIQYYYQISAVHENNLEGTRTDEVKAPLR